MRNCAKRFARRALTPQAGEMCETGFALMACAKLFIANSVAYEAAVRPTATVAISDADPRQ